MTVKPFLALVLALATAACADDAAPTLSIGSLELPAAALQSLQDPERQMFVDLLAFGQAVAADELSNVGATYVERGVARARLDNLPLFLGARRAAVDEATMQEAYVANPDWELVVRHVVRLAEPEASASIRDSARAIAAEVAARAAAGEDFAALAASYSEEPGAAERGGLLEPGRRGSWVDEFWAAAITLRPGQTSPVVETPYGYHVLRLEERRPVPFEEADRAEMLRWFVPASVADAAMSDWVATDGGLQADRTAIAAAFDSLRGGSPIRESQVLATSASGTLQYTGRDWAAGWQLIPSEERVLLERGTLESFAAWLENDAREVLWATMADDLGVPVSKNTPADASRYWDELATAFASVFGFAPGMSDEEVIAVATQALLSGTPEARSGRSELRSLRPRLRQLYPLTEPAPAS